MKVKIAVTPEENQKIYHFRYEVYIEEMQKRIRCADHTERIHKDKLDETAMLFYIECENQIVATVRKNVLSSSSLSNRLSQAFAINQFAAAFSSHSLSFSSRLMIAPERRNSLLLNLIVMEFYRDARARNLQFDFSHAAPWLVPFYENLGYRRYTESFLDPDVGLQIPMVLIIEDIEHLQAVRSPFYRFARKVSNDPTAKQWFTQTFPEHQRLINTCSNTIDEIWKLWLAKLQQQSAHRIDLFQGLTYKEIQQLLKASCFHQAKAGDILLRTGDIANAVFLVLSGVIEVGRTDRGVTTRLVSFQSFGEATLLTQSPSPEWASALTDVEILVLPLQTIMKAMKTSPETMGQFFFNASRWFCQKYGPHSAPQINNLPAVQPQQFRAV